MREFPWVVTLGRNQDTEAAGREMTSVLCHGNTNTVAKWANVQKLDVYCRLVSFSVMY